jgi:hypothetical protein
MALELGLQRFQLGARSPELRFEHADPRLETLALGRRDDRFGEVRRTSAFASGETRFDLEPTDFGARRVDARANEPLVEADQHVAGLDGIPFATDHLDDRPGHAKCQLRGQTRFDATEETTHDR